MVGLADECSVRGSGHPRLSQMLSPGTEYTGGRIATIVAMPATVERITVPIPKARSAMAGRDDGGHGTCVNTTSGSSKIVITPLLA